MNQSPVCGLCVSLQQQQPCFSAVCRLAKRWLAAQLFSGDIIEEAADLLVASLFLQPAPFTPPRYSLEALSHSVFLYTHILAEGHSKLIVFFFSSPQVGLLRFFHLLSTFDWKNNPLVVNLNGKLTGQHRKKPWLNCLLSGFCLYPSFFCPFCSCWLHRNQKPLPGIEEIFARDVYCHSKWQECVRLDQRRTFSSGL